MAKSVNQDVIIIGGGNIGSALAYGLVHQGLSVAVLDEGDIAYRAGYANFGLIWFQGKGMGNQSYVDFTLEATRKWPSFARHLEERSGVSLDYSKMGGLCICLGADGFAERDETLRALADQSPSGRYDCEMLERRQLETLIPRMRLGPEVSGASFSPHDGHVNPLYLIRALHAAFQRAGGRYYPGARVTGIEPRKDHFVVEAGKGRFQAAKLVLAAGVGIPSLAGKLGIRIQVRPQRGQVLVTERVRPVLDYPTMGVRQTAEGTFLLGTSNEEAGFDSRVTMAAVKEIAARAVGTFPDLSGICIQRCWAGLRPLTPDGYPIYHQSSRHPGAYVVTSHSGVTLTSQLAGPIARWIHDGTRPAGFEAFNLGRFDD